jgi:hypothetical protein
MSEGTNQNERGQALAYRAANQLSPRARGKDDENRIMAEKDRINHRTAAIVLG